MRAIILLLMFCFLSFCPVTAADSPFGVVAEPAAVKTQANTIEDDRPPMDGTTEEAIDFYSRRYADPEEAWEISLEDRNRLDPTNIPLRDAEHYWWARFQVQKAKWYMKPYKYVQQVICTLGYSTYKLLREPITGNTTPPSFREIKYGLKGAWDGLFPPGKSEETSE